MGIFKAIRMFLPVSKLNAILRVWATPFICLAKKTFSLGAMKANGASSARTHCDSIISEVLSLSLSPLPRWWGAWGSPVDPPPRPRTQLVLFFFFFNCLAQSVFGNSGRLSSVHFCVNVVIICQHYFAFDSWNWLNILCGFILLIFCLFFFFFSWELEIQLAQSASLAMTVQVPRTIITSVCIS